MAEVMTIVNEPKKKTWKWVGLNGVYYKNIPDYSFDVAKNCVAIDKDCDVVIILDKNRTDEYKVLPNIKCNIYKVYLGVAGCLVDKTKIECGAGSDVSIVHIFCAKSFSTNSYFDVEVNMIGENSKFNASNGYILRNKDSLDMNYTINQAARNTTCNIRSSGTLFDDARKLYRATIDFIAPCAGSIGRENEEVLILSNSAVSKSLPVLLCNEEDVEGIHGATIGKMDDEQLFYMTSRGLSIKEAQNLVAISKINSLAQNIPDEKIKDELLG